VNVEEGRPLIRHGLRHGNTQNDPT
jgi:hypothetical protein